MGSFDEHTEKAREIEMWFERFLGQVELLTGIHYINPKHDMARRFMNEIEEYKPVGEVKETMETIKYKVKRIKGKAETVKDNTNENETKQYMWEIIEVCKEALELLDEVAAAANKVKYSIR